MATVEQKKPGVLVIHGKEYETVAYRIDKFRKSDMRDHSLVTEIIERSEECVIMKCTITDPGGVIVGTGHAEERRSGNGVNLMSALENCETSAIGRALAACGYVSSMEAFASADEMQRAADQSEYFEAEMWEKYDDVCVECADYIEAINQGIDEENFEMAAGAWMALTDEQKKALWRPSPTKIRDAGRLPAFSTKQKNAIKSDEFQKIARSI